MARILQRLAVAVGIVVCAPTIASAQLEPPDDFLFEYRHNSGPLPPPHQFQYRLIVSPQGAVDMTFEGGGGEDWTTSFDLENEVLQQLWEGMFEVDVIGRIWELAQERSVGGGSAWLRFGAFGNEVEVPSELAESDDREVFGAFEAFAHVLMPAEVFARLPATIQARFAQFRS